MNVLLVYNEQNEAASAAIPSMVTWLTGLQISCQLTADYRHDAQLSLDDVSLAVSLGGDGTLLRAARLVAPYDIPLLGLSYGNLGFLTGASAHESMVAIERALAGELHEQRRTMVEAEVSSILREHARFEPGFGLCYPAQSVCTHRLIGLNDVAIDRGARPRMLEYKLAINGVVLARHRGDGLVISTASGSTGYALSAGGPILAPTAKGLLVVPLATHSLMARPVVTDASDVVEVLLHHQRLTDVRLYVDGVEHLTDHLILGARVYRAPHKIRLLEMETDRFYAKVASTFFGQSDACALHKNPMNIEDGQSNPLQTNTEPADKALQMDIEAGISDEQPVIKRVWL